MNHIELIFTSGWVSSTICWKAFFFFGPLCCLCSSVKDSLTVFMFFYSIPFIYLSVLLSMPYHLDYYGFIVSISLKVKIQYQLSNFVLLQYCIGYLETFVSPYKLQNHFIDTHKNDLLGFLFGLHWICIESLNRQYSDFLLMKMEYLSFVSSLIHLFISFRVL